MFSIHTTALLMKKSAEEKKRNLLKKNEMPNANASVLSVQKT